MFVLTTKHTQHPQSVGLIEVRNGGFRSVYTYTPEQMWRGLVFPNREDAEAIARHIRVQWKRPVQVYSGPQLERILRKTPTQKSRR